MSIQNTIHKQSHHTHREHVKISPFKSAIGVKK
jgi:hypothetical protein